MPAMKSYFTRRYDDGLLIRPPRPEDSRLVYEYYRHPAVARTTLSLPSNEFSQTERWLERSNENQHRFLAVMDERPVGTIGLIVSTLPRRPRRASLGLMVHPDYWGRGIGRRLLAHVLQLADDWLNLVRVELGVFDSNPRAVRLYEREGFQEIGRRPMAAYGPDGWLTEILMTRCRPEMATEWQGPLPTLEPAEPVPLPGTVTVRPLAESDLDAAYDLWLQPDVWGPAGDRPSLELLAAKEKVGAASSTRHRLVAEADGHFLGLGTLQHNSRNPRRAHSGDINILVHPVYQRQGVGVLLGQALLSIADDWLNLQRVTGRALAGNEAGLALAARLGFQPVATSKRAIFGYGHWHNVVILNRLQGVPALTSYPQTSNISPPPRRALAGPITIEPFDPAHIPDLYRCFNHPLVANTTAQIPSVEFSTLEARLTPSQSGLYRLVALHKGEAIGLCSIYQWEQARRAHSAGLGMMVHPEFWGYGVGSQLMTKILDLADNRLGLQRVDLEVTTDNPAGIALYQKFGFRLDGTIPYYLYGGGRWAHVHVMSRWHNHDTI